VLGSGIEVLHSPAAKVRMKQTRPVSPPNGVNDLLSSRFQRKDHYAFAKGVQNLLRYLSASANRTTHRIETSNFRAEEGEPRFSLAAVMRFPTPLNAKNRMNSISTDGSAGRGPSRSSVHNGGRRSQLIRKGCAEPPKGSSSGRRIGLAGVLQSLLTDNFLSCRGEEPQLMPGSGNEILHTPASKGIES
jgi:hypothetical protein